jgi:monoamine oxidase
LAGEAAAPRLGVKVLSVEQTADGVSLETTQGTITAKTAVLTMPTTLIANGSIAFKPGLPDSHMMAAQHLPHGNYERLVFTLGDDPFSEERDRAVILLNDKNKSLYMLAGGGGYGVHFADFGGDEAKELASKGIDAMADVVEDWLDMQVGSAAARSIKPLYMSNWCNDQMAMGSWSVAKPGHADARLALRAPVAERIWFAGEATSVQQWGTVGGAWLEGIRVANEVSRFIAMPESGHRWFSFQGFYKPKRIKARPRNLT